MKIKYTLFLILFAHLKLVCAQGFINLNFESAKVSAYGSGPASVPTTNAIPGWTAYINGVTQSSITYNTVSLGAANVSLLGTNSSSSPVLEGEFSVALQGNNSPGSITAAIGQTGQIPFSAMSMTFWGDVSTAVVSFDGQVLSPIQTGNIGSYYYSYAVDISAFADQTGELLFTAPSHDSAIIDNIQFSVNPVPEPGALGLSTLGGILLCCRRWKQLKPKV